MADAPYTIGVDRDRFVPLASLAVGLALAAGIALGVSRHYGNYFVFVSCFYAFLPCLGLAYLAVTFGRCRNTYLAAGLAVIVASLIYWTQFPTALAADAGPQALTSPTTVVKYAAWRISHESFDSYRPARDDERSRKRRPRAEPGVNWVIAIGEWGGMLLAATALLVWRSRRPYCERCQSWKSREAFQTRQKSGRSILELFEAGTLDQMGQFALARSQGPSPAWVSVEYCPRIGPSGEHCPVFFSVFDRLNWRPVRRTLENGARAEPGPLRSNKPAYWIERAPLDEKQIDALSGLFTSMALALGRTAGQERAQAKSNESPQPLATFELAPAGSPSLKWRGELLRPVIYRLPILIFSFSMMVFVVIAIAFVDPGVSSEGRRLASVAVCGILALPLALFAQLGRRYLASILSRRTFKKVLLERADRWIDPSRVGSDDLVFIDATHHQSAAGRADESVSDTGFLAFDFEHRQIVFEGDSQRFRLPAQAILSVVIQTVADHFGGFIPLIPRREYVVSVRASTARGPVEIWFHCHNVRRYWQGVEGRHEDAQRLVSRISELVGDVPDS